MQRDDIVALAVDKIRPSLLSETEQSDPSVGSKRRRVDPGDASTSYAGYSR